LYVWHVPPHVFLVLYGRKMPLLMSRNQPALDEPESTCQIVKSEVATEASLF
jgi:hypothetical protein